MRRLTYGGVFVLVASGLALGAPLAASAVPCVVNPKN
jgi:hypothetical protein